MRLIDADALIDSLELMYEHRDDEDEPYNIGVRGAINMTRKAPTIEPKRGEWIYGEHDVAMCDGYRCNRCDFFVPWDYEHKFIDFINDYHFCPNCGADMRGADDE